MIRTATFRLIAAIALAAVGSLIAKGSSDPGLGLPAEGWARWQVPAVAGAPAWCCIDWNGKRAAASTCKLDERNGGYSSRDERTTETMHIYARFENGAPTRIRALGPACPVQTRTAIVDLGERPADLSARWLARQIDADDRLAGDALAALATHAGAIAREALIGMAGTHPKRERRKDAVFWIGQLRAGDSARELKAILFDDPDPKMREHAAFSLSQSAVPDRTDALIRLGRTDPEPQVRSQAWFWLAQTAAPESEAAIAEALAREHDHGVREQAIFALSQLPQERAVDSLGAIVSDPTRSQADRKHALFWLGQSDSLRAHAYLAELLDAD